MTVQDEVGSLEVGKAFDCLVVDCGKFSPDLDKADSGRIPYEVFPDDTNLDRLEKYVQLGDDRNIKQVFIAGTQVL